MSNTWGALAWGQGSWAAQGDVGTTVSGISASFSIGSVAIDNEIQVGWGGDTWGENEWGDLSGSQPTITGIQASFSIGTLSSVTGGATAAVSGSSLTLTNAGAVGGTSADVSLTGQSLTASLGEEVIDIGVPVTTAGSLTSAAGSTTIDPTFLIGEGWGRDSWGNLGWGVNFSAQNTGGLALTSAIGSETSFTDCTVSVTGQSLSTTFGTFSVKVDQDLSITVAEHTMTMSMGSPSLEQSTNESVSTAGLLQSAAGNAVGGLKTPVDFSGIQMTATLGSPSLVQTTVESVTGQALTSALGSIAAIDQVMVGVSGLPLTMGMGEENTQSNANVSLTGIALTSSIGSPNITPWSEVNLGVDNTWTEVDLAA